MPDGRCDKHRQRSVPRASFVHCPERAMCRYDLALKNLEQLEYLVKVGSDTEKIFYQAGSMRLSLPPPPPPSVWGEGGGKEG